MHLSFPRSSVLGLAIALLATVPAFADVKTREKGQVKFEGALGTAARMFGGKAASEGIVSSNALKGSRKATFTDTTGRIVNLGEEKVYDIDMRKKEYRVTTFEELRRQLREAQERAAKEAKEAAKDAPKEGPAAAERRQAGRGRVRSRRQGNRPDQAARRLRRAPGHHHADRSGEGQDPRRERRPRGHGRLVAWTGHPGSHGDGRVRAESTGRPSRRRRRRSPPNRWRRLPRSTRWSSRRWIGSVRSAGRSRARRWRRR